MTARQLINAVAGLDAQHQPPLSPDIDGWLIAHSPAEVFASGQELPIPLMLGSNTLEVGSMPAPVTPKQLRKEIQDFMGDLSPRALALYGLANAREGVSDPLYGTTADQWPADLRFHCPATTVALWHNATHQPTYEYQCDYAIPGVGTKGAKHTYKLPYPTFRTFELAISVHSQPYA
jgi:carboxylesterase type B